MIISYVFVIVVHNQNKRICYQRFPICFQRPERWLEILENVQTIQTQYLLSVDTIRSYQLQGIPPWSIGKRCSTIDLIERYIGISINNVIFLCFEVFRRLQNGLRYIT